MERVADQRQPPGYESVVVSEVVELLETLWERGREVATATVSGSQLRALYIVDREAGINLRGLAAALGSSAPSTSRLCDRLQALGLLCRSPGRASRRERELRLTDRGRDYLEELRCRRERDLAGVVAAMPSDSLAALLQGLTSFRRCVEESTPPHGRRHSGS